MKAKKSLGQHFLKSEKALKSLIDVSNLSPSDTILEIGPGQGVLTEKLLESSSHVIAVEKDDSLYALLETKFEKEIADKKLELILGDILDFDLSRLRASSYKLVANIPYNITGAILEKFLSVKQQPSQMTLLVQREVAKRIVASDAKESILSISIKAYGTPAYIETVKAGSFVPIPQVDSAIITINNISKGFFDKFDEEQFFKMVRAGFKSKRKKLSSNLSPLFPKERVRETFDTLKLDPNVRAEDISLEDWREILLYLSA